MPKVKRKVVAATNTPAKPKSKKKAKASAARIARSKPVFFCDPDLSDEGHFLSPWWSSQFEVKEVVYRSAGQYIMAEKARAFGDEVGMCERYIVIDLLTHNA
jgi:predicted NAD-dependent protein-ADP-ribosyltransferase YbiA (DUF1768 family)